LLHINTVQPHEYQTIRSKTNIDTT